MSDIQAYVDDIKNYTSDVDMEVVEELGRRMAGTMAKADARYVAASDTEELARVREGFVNEKLGVKDDAKADEAIAKVAEKMSGDRTKSRVTFYYLLIEELGAKSAYIK
jgi:hypothetical protein